MAAASGCSLEIEAAAVPLIDGAYALVRGNIPGGGRTNREHFGAGVRVADGIDADLVDLLYDPQTSGGLLVAVAAPECDALLAAFASAGVPAARIGRGDRRRERADRDCLSERTGRPERPALQTCVANGTQYSAGLQAGAAHRIV